MEFDDGVWHGGELVGRAGDEHRSCVSGERAVAVAATAHPDRTRLNSEDSPCRRGHHGARTRVTDVSAAHGANGDEPDGELSSIAERTVRRFVVVDCAGRFVDRVSAVETKPTAVVEVDRFDAASHAMVLFP